MKFPIEFICCFSPSVQSSSTTKTTQHPPAISLSSSSSSSSSPGGGGGGLRMMSEEIRLLMPLSSMECNNSPHSYRRRQQQLNRSNSLPVHWKPSLSAISEDNVAFVLTRREPTLVVLKSGGKLLAGNSRAKAKTHRRRHKNPLNEYRRSTSTPTFIPTFAPTTFLF